MKFGWTWWMCLWLVRKWVNMWNGCHGLLTNQFTPIRGLEKAAFERWPKTSLVGQLRESAKWWQNWRGLRFHRSLQFGVGNPPANSLMVFVGYGYGKDVVSDVAGARIRPCWCQVCTAPWAVKLAQRLCPRVLFLVIRSGMTVLGQYFVATSGCLWYSLQLRW